MGLERVSDGNYWINQKTDPNIGKRTQHIVFIPWDTNEGAEWNQKTANWNLARPGKFTIVNYQVGVVKVDLGTVSNNPKGVVYIRGHGNPGFPYIMANYQAAHYDAPVGLVLNITDACQRLIDSGLTTAFSGAIKFYSCHSGTKPTANARTDAIKALADQKPRSQAWIQAAREELARLPDTDENKAKRGIAQQRLHHHSEVLKKGDAQDKSLARQGADYMRHQGFTNCIYYGYLGPLGSTYELDTDEDRTRVHKKVELEGLQSWEYKYWGVKTCRPSVARVQV
jgi:hypothetical protein